MLRAFNRKLGRETVINFLRRRKKARRRGISIAKTNLRRTPIDGMGREKTKEFKMANRSRKSSRGRGSRAGARGAKKSTRRNKTKSSGRGFASTGARRQIRQVSAMGARTSQDGRTSSSQGSNEGYYLTQPQLRRENKWTKRKIRPTKVSKPLSSQHGQNGQQRQPHTSSTGTNQSGTSGAPNNSQGGAGLPKNNLPDANQ